VTTAETVRRRVSVADPQGLHARPCAAVAKTMRKFECSATLRAGGRTADARSVLELLGLGLVTATEVEIVATGRDAPGCVDALARLLLTPPG